MNWLRKLRPRFSALFQKEKLDARMDDEMRSHIELQTQENIEAGMNPDEARYAALRQFGWAESLKDTCRDQRGIAWIENLAQDIRYGARMLRKNPGFTALAVLTLALGIGANTAIFSLVNAALLRALPYPAADRLVVVWADKPAGQPGLPISPPANADVAQWRRHTESFANIAAFSARTADLAEGGESERIGAAGVTAGFFETLGVTPLLGRTLTADEETPGGPPVVLISHGLWQRRFGGDSTLVGKVISVNGDKRTVIGILPPEFDFPRGADWPAFYPFPGRTDLWLPLGFRAQDDGSGWSSWASRDERGLVVVGRLKRDVGLRQAQAEMDAFAAREANDHPDTHKDWILKLVSMSEQMAGKSRKALLILFAAVGLLLLIACVNVANLLLARGVARQQEMAVRAALGAGRSRLLRQLLTECLLLGVLGSGLGLLVARVSLKVFLALNPLTYSRLNEASLDPAALAFAAIIALITSIVFGLVPAFQTSRFDLRSSLQESGRAADGGIRDRVRTWLVATEVALALALLTVAGLMVRSFLQVQAVRTGFRSDSVLAFDVQLSGARYSTEAAQIAFFDRLVARLEALPGVRAAGAISYLPLAGGENLGSFQIEGDPPVLPGNEPNAERRWITPGYFATMSIPIKQGRGFKPSDREDQQRVVVINETLAKSFGSRDPLGRQIKVGGAWRAIVGVVSDVKNSSLEKEIGPQLYVPFAQWAWGGMTVVLRSEGDPRTLVAAARRELNALDPFLPAANVRTMEQVLSKASSSRRFNAALLAFFALAALLLTVVGIYGVVAFLVSRRSREIGIRMALGAQRRDVLALILRQGMTPVAIGSSVGVAASLAASRLIASQLYGISSFDPVTLTFIVAALLATTLLACWVPARRATYVNPMEALRQE